MGLYTLPADNSSKKNSYKKPWGQMGLYTLPADNSSKNKTISQNPWVDGSLHPSSRQFI